MSYRYTSANYRALSDGLQDEFQLGHKTLQKIWESLEKPQESQKSGKSLKNHRVLQGAAQRGAQFYFNSCGSPNPFLFMQPNEPFRP